MSPNEIQTTIGPNNLPETTRKLGTLPQLHYADAFTHSLPEDYPNHSPEQWARAMFGDVPSPLQKFIWHGFLRFTLQEEPSPESIGGCPVDERGEDWIRFGNSSWLMAVNLIVQKTGQQVTFVTLVQYRSWVTHIWWPLLSFFHRTGGAMVLRTARRRIDSGKYATTQTDG